MSACFALRVRDSSVRGAAVQGREAEHGGARVRGGGFEPGTRMARACVCECVCVRGWHESRAQPDCRNGAKEDGVVISLYP